MAFRVLVLLGSLPLVLGSCALLPAGVPPDVPELDRRTLAPGDLVRVTDRRAGDAPAVERTVAPDGSLEVPGIGTLPVHGYTVADLECVLASLGDGPTDLAVEVVPPRSGRPPREPGGAGAGRAIEAAAAGDAAAPLPE